MKKIKLVAAILAGVLLCSTCLGCSGFTKYKDDDVCGGVTDRTDPGAPKEIKSKNIVSFYARCYAYNGTSDDPMSGTHVIRIEDNEQGEHVLSMKGVYDRSMVVDDQVLVEVQKIIDQYNLVENNGAGRVTAGLPPEFEPWELTVEYDSGEKLHFNENGEPDADWTAALRDYFVALTGSDDTQEDSAANSLDLYRDQLNRVYEILVHGNDLEDIQDHEFALASYASYAGQEEALSNVGYAIRDLSGDGIPELAIISMESGREAGSFLYMLYSMENREPKLIFSGGGRTAYDWLGNGRFLYYGASGAASTMYSTYQLASDGLSIQCEECWFCEITESEEGIYYNRTGSWEKSESERTDMDMENFWNIYGTLSEEKEFIEAVPFTNY